MAAVRQQEGAPTWIDLGCHDVPAAVAFYGQLFGWSFEDLGPEAGGYGLFRKDGALVAGIGPAQDPDQPVVWSTYLAVDDCVAACRRAEEERGQVVMGPLDVVGQGRMAFVLDPQGATVGLWEAGAHGGVEVVDAPGALTWNELQTSDPDAAATFYTAVFGWELERTQVGERPYTLVEVGGRSVAGMLPLQQEGVPSRWEVTFAVADADAAAADAIDRGGQVLSGPDDLPDVGRFVVVQDLEGALFGLLQDVSA